MSLRVTHVKVVPLRREADSGALTDPRRAYPQTPSDFRCQWSACSLCSTSGAASLREPP
jgi:hypothetical protein